MFSCPKGQSYPTERAETQRIFREKLIEVKKLTHTNFKDILRNIDILKTIVHSDTFEKYFYQNYQLKNIETIRKKGAS